MVESAVGVHGGISPDTGLNLAGAAWAKQSDAKAAVMSESETTNSRIIRIRDAGLVQRISEITSLVNLSENRPLPSSANPHAMQYSCFRWLKREGNVRLPHYISLGYNKLFVVCRVSIKFDLYEAARDPEYDPPWWPLPLMGGNGNLRCVLMEEVEEQPGEKLSQALRDLPLWEKAIQGVAEEYKRIDHKELELRQKFQDQKITWEAFEITRHMLEAKCQHQVSKLLRRYQFDDTASTRSYIMNQVRPDLKSSTPEMPSYGARVTTYSIEQDQQIICCHNVAGMQHITRDIFWDHIQGVVRRHREWVHEHFSGSRLPDNLRRYNSGVVKKDELSEEIEQLFESGNDRNKEAKTHIINKHQERYRIEQNLHSLNTYQKTELRDLVNQRIRQYRYRLKHRQK